jgi:hypothetical protein
MNVSYRLYYKNVFVGTVLTEETDFPSISGSIEFNLSTAEEAKEIQDYIDFSIEASDKVLGDDKEYDEFIDREESKQQSIIDSVDWTLVSEGGVKTKILVPVFLTYNGINVRFQ